MQSTVEAPGSERHFSAVGAEVEGAHRAEGGAPWIADAAPAVSLAGGALESAAGLVAGSGQAETPWSCSAARALAVLGVQSARALWLDLDASPGHGRVRADGLAWVTLREDRNDPAPLVRQGEGAVDSQFPGSLDLSEQLRLLPVNGAITRRLSPRRWLVGWRVDGRRALLARLHWREPRRQLTPLEQDLVRMAATAALRADRVDQQWVPVAGAPILEPAGAGVPQPPEWGAAFWPRAARPVHHRDHGHHGCGKPDQWGQATTGRRNPLWWLGAVVGALAVVVLTLGMLGPVPDAGPSGSAPAVLSDPLTRSGSR